MCGIASNPGRTRDCSSQDCKALCSARHKLELRYSSVCIKILAGLCNQSKKTGLLTGFSSRHVTRQGFLEGEFYGGKENRLLRQETGPVTGFQVGQDLASAPRLVLKTVTGPVSSRKTLFSFPV